MVSLPLTRSFHLAPPRRPRTAVVNGVLAVLLPAAVVIAYLQIGNPPGAATAAVRTTVVRSGTLTKTVSGTGNAASPAETAVNFATGGTLTAVYVTPGQAVTKGQKLARIDPTSAQLALSNAEAQLASAQAAYTQTAAGASSTQKTKDALAVKAAQLTVNSAATAVTSAESQLATDTTTLAAAVTTAQNDLKAGTGTQAQVTTAQQNQTSTLAKDTQAITAAKQQLASANNQLANARLTAQADAAPTAAQLAQAQAGLTQAENAVATAQKTLDQTTLTAPQAGTVLAVNGAVGQNVSGGSATPVSSSSASSGTSGASGGGSGNGTGSSGSSSGFVTIAALNHLTVTADIAEADAAGVKAGQSATVTFPATQTQVHGTVTTVALQSITSNNVIQYPVTVTLSGVPAAVRLGASAEVAITTSTVEDAEYVSSSAVTGAGGTHVVTVLRGGTQQVVPVQIGLVGDQGTQILSGLSVGDQVVLPTTTTTTSSGGGGRFGGGLGGLGGARG